MISCHRNKHLCLKRTALTPYFELIGNFSERHLLFILWVTGFIPDRIDGDHDPTILGWTVFLVVQVVGFSMGLQQGVTAQVVTNTVAVNRWCFLVITISIFADLIGFVECDPRLNFVSELFEAQVRVIPEVINHLRVCPTSEILECLGQVPVEQGDLQAIIYNYVLS